MELLKLIAGVAGLVGVARAQTVKPAVPVEPLTAILDAFRTHPLVALADHHGNEQDQAFRLMLIRDPRFAGTVNDIVVEFGNARYQDVIDRFVRGEEVPYESLRQVWQNTTQVEYEWDLPIYEEFFRAVRGVNTSLPRERQIRVVLGDTPINWDNVKTTADLVAGMGNRDEHAVGVIRREVLAKGRRALIIYGEQHLLRKNSVLSALDEWAGGLVAQLERPGIASVFTIHSETRADLTAIQADVASWPQPRLAMLRGTQLGAALFDSGPQKRPVGLEEQFDALLYLGPVTAMTSSVLSPALCSDRGYMEMRVGRLALVGPPPGAPISPADRLKEYCANPNVGSEIADKDPKITAMVRETLRDAAEGKVDPARFAPEARARLTEFLQMAGPRFLKPAGELKSIILLMDSTEAGKRSRRYRATFASGEKIVLSVGLSPEETLLSFDPRPE